MKYQGLIKHGESRHDAESAEYLVWVDMRHRCNCKSATGYPYYGARGVCVCERWDDFAAFLADVGRRPTPQHSIDRIISTGNYEPDNCRWATKQQQMRNTSYNRLLTLDGVTLCVAAWAEKLGISVNTIRKRVYSGYTDAQALSTTHFSRRWRR